MLLTATTASMEPSDIARAVGIETKSASPQSEPPGLPRRSRAARAALRSPDQRRLHFIFLKTVSCQLLAVSQKREPDVKHNHQLAR